MTNISLKMDETIERKKERYTYTIEGKTQEKEKKMNE